MIMLPTKGPLLPLPWESTPVALHVPTCFVWCVGEEPGKWTDTDWGKLRLTLSLFTIQRLCSALILPLENLCGSEKDSK